MKGIRKTHSLAMLEQSLVRDIFCTWKSMIHLFHNLYIGQLNVKFSNLSLRTCISPWPWSLGFILWFSLLSSFVIWDQSDLGVFSFVPFAMFFCVKDTRFISLSMGVVGLRAASLCTNWQEPALVGSSNHNPFAAILSHAWQACSISSDQRFRIQKDWTRKRALWRAEYRAVKRDVR
jgi:hypothetical protein